jgi:sulfur-carrier protein
MAVKVLIPTPLRQYAEKNDSVEVEAKTVAEALQGLTARYADLRRHLYNDEGKIRSFVNIYLNDEDIRYLGKEQTPISDKDVLSIVPSIAGGTTVPVAAPASDCILRCICS